MRLALIVFLVAARPLCSEAQAPADGSTPSTVDIAPRAAELEAQGRFAEAASALRPLVDRYPEEYALQLRLAWDLFRAEAYEEALTHYEAAAALSGGSADSHLGLGWTLLRLGRCGDAAPHWSALLEETPDHGLALEGRRICDLEAGTRVAFELGVVGHAYTGHAFLRRAVGGFASGAAVLEGLVVLGATYRVTAFESEGGSTAPGPGPGPMPMATGTSVAWQSDLYLTAGLRSRDVEVTLHYAFVSSDVPDLVELVHAAGAIARLRPFGEIVVEASYAFGSETHTFRVAPSWWLPLTEWLSLRPGGAAQWTADGDRYGAGELTALVHGDLGALWLGGRVGVQYRPVFLEQSSVYNIDDRIREGAWIGGSLRIDGGLSLRLDYELQRRLAPPLDESGWEAWAHFGVVRLRWEST